VQDVLGQHVKGCDDGTAHLPGNRDCAYAEVERHLDVDQVVVRKDGGEHAPLRPSEQEPHLPHDPVGEGIVNGGKTILPGVGTPPARTVTVWPRSRSNSVNRRVETTPPLAASSHTSIAGQERRADTISLACEDAVRQVLVEPVLGLWDAVTAAEDHS
jgi:hypothetical protein